jgi:hypothetical protein
MLAMRFDSASRALTSWVATLAFLMAALAPSISHALGKNGTFLIDVCSSVVAKWVQPVANSTDQVPAQGDLHSIEPCPYCSLHASFLAIPVSPVVLLRACSHYALLSNGHPAAPRTLYAWASAQPRAPPLNF